MPPNVDAMVRQGIDAFKDGRKEEARTFLMKAVDVDQYNEQAWLWLSAVVETIEDQRTCLENVLAINPKNARARASLQMITEHMTSPPMPDLSSSTSLDMNDYFPDGPDFEAPQASAARPAAPVRSGKAAAGEAAGGQSSSPFGPGSFDAGDDDLFSNGFASGPFSTDDFEDIFTPPTVSAGAIPPPTMGPPPRAQVMSPGRETSPREAAASASMFPDNDFDDMDDSEAQDLFRLIPAEIKPTRLPGTRERYPILAVLMLILLVMLNVVGTLLLLYRLGVLPLGI